MATLPNESRNGAGAPPVKGVVDARQAVTTGHMRWVLRVSLVLSVLAMLGAWALISHQMGHAHGGNVSVTPGAAQSGGSNDASHGDGASAVSSPGSKAS